MKIQDIHDEDGESVSIQFRGTYDGSYYVGIANNYVYLGKTVNGWTELGNNNPTINFNQFYTLKVIVSGNEFDVYLDGVWQFKTFDSTFPQGTVGISAYKSLGTYESFRVIFPYNDDLITINPTTSPTSIPTYDPTTRIPTSSPTKYPTAKPSQDPSSSPTISPTISPTKEPTDKPTIAPTHYPTTIPTKEPTHIPSEDPTHEPTIIRLYHRQKHRRSCQRNIQLYLPFPQPRNQQLYRQSIRL